MTNTAETKTFKSTIKLEIEVTREQLSDMVFGTGALTWEWWIDADESDKGIEFTYLNEDSKQTKRLCTWAGLVGAFGFAYEKHVLSHYVYEDPEGLKEPGLMDADDADRVLQIACGLHSIDGDGNVHVIYG